VRAGNVDAHAWQDDRDIEPEDDLNQQRHPPEDPDVDPAQCAKHRVHRQSHGGDDNAEGHAEGH
jgi:hypothetical protein